MSDDNNKNSDPGSDEDKKPKSLVPFKDLGASSKSDYATALIGGSAGLVIDKLLLGLSGGWFTLAGASGALGVKRAIEAYGEKEKLIRKCEQLKEFYKRQKDNEKLEKITILIDKINVVKEMSVEEIKEELKKIEDS